MISEYVRSIILRHSIPVDETAHEAIPEYNRHYLELTSENCDKKINRYLDAIIICHFKI